MLRAIDDSGMKVRGPHPNSEVSSELCQCDVLLRAIRSRGRFPWAVRSWSSRLQAVAAQVEPDSGVCGADSPSVPSQSRELRHGTCRGPIPCHGGKDSLQSGRWIQRRCADWLGPWDEPPSPVASKLLGPDAGRSNMRPIFLALWDEQGSVTGADNVSRLRAWDDLPSSSLCQSIRRLSSAPSDK